MSNIPLHKSEGNLSSGLNVDIRSMDDILSTGLTFNPSEKICHAQLLKSTLKFAGAESPPEPWWQTPFNRDPDLGYSTLPRFRGYLKVVATAPKLRWTPSVGQAEGSGLWPSVTNARL